MELILAMLPAFFDQVEVNPESISEVEILPEGSPGEWHIHVQPEQSWFAVVHYLTSQMRGDCPGNLSVARQRLQPGGRRPNFFSGNRPIFGSAIHRPVTLRQPEARVA